MTEPNQKIKIILKNKLLFLVFKDVLKQYIDETDVGLKTAGLDYESWIEYCALLVLCHLLLVLRLTQISES